MGKGRDKAGKRGAGLGNHADKMKERSERARLRKDRQRNAGYCFSDADDKAFEEQVEQIGCKIRFMAGDGNCLFRSVADQIEGNPDEHASVRAMIMDHLERNRDVFEPYMEDDESFGDYLERMRGDAEWGGNQELVAASQLYKANVVVHQFKAPRFFIPCDKAKLTIHLSYHGDYHYNSVRAIGDEGRGPAQPITLHTPIPAQRKDVARAAGASSPWPEQERAVARSCPWATRQSIVQALESSGGRGDDAIELLIAARNEPALAESANAGKNVDGAVSTAPISGSASADQGAGDAHLNEGVSVKRGKSGGSGVGLANGNGNNREKSSPDAKGTKAKKIPRASDCPCGSGLKYKKCCRKKDAAIARGQVAISEPDSVTTTASDSRLADDLGSLVI